MLVPSVAIVLWCAPFLGISGAALTGKVTETGGTAIAGARVTLKNHLHFVMTTDAAGAFTLSTAVAIPVPARNAPERLEARSGQLFFHIRDFTRQARCEIFDGRGARAGDFRWRNRAAGSHAVPLARLPSGLYFVRLTTDNAVITSTLLSCDRTVSIRQHSRIETATRGSGPAAFVATRFADTLIITAQGYQHALKGIDGYDQQNIACTLAVSNPWKPSGALTHEKGMVKITAKGHDFEMGQPDPNVGGAGAATNELPAHTVQFTYDFWMDTTEVTQKAYDSAMKIVYADYVTPMDWDPLYGKGDRYPTYLVYWGNAALYCNARSKMEGLDTVYRYDSKNAPAGELCELSGVSADLSKNGYRLPTEAEWEYACRAGGATDFFWGKNYGAYPASAADSAEIKENAVWRANSWDLGEGVAGFGNHQAGASKPNAYGLYDMAGNVSEHCHDYESAAYGYGTVIDPAGPATADVRIIRGGNWGNDAIGLRSANRTFSAANYPFFFVGFRTVRPIR